MDRHPAGLRATNEKTRLVTGHGDTANLFHVPLVATIAYDVFGGPRRRQHVQFHKDAAQTFIHRAEIIGGKQGAPQFKKPREQVQEFWHGLVSNV